MAYTVSGMFLFGRRVWEYSTFTNAIPFTFLMLFGDFDWDQLKAEHPMVAGLWFFRGMYVYIYIYIYDNSVDTYDFPLGEPLV